MLRLTRNSLAAQALVATLWITGCASPELAVQGDAPAGEKEAVRSIAPERSQESELRHPNILSLINHRKFKGRVRGPL